MMTERTQEYGEIRSLVSTKRFWEVPTERVFAEAVSKLPDMRKSSESWHNMRVTKWLGRRPGSSESWWRRDNFLQRERGYYAAARREAGEFIRAVFFEDKTIEEIQNELGDTLFFLLLSTKTFHFKNEARDLLTEAQFGQIPDKYRREILNQKPERVVESAVSILDAEMGYGSDKSLVYQDKTKALSVFAIYIIFRYAVSVGWDLAEIFERVEIKNNYNYPSEFYRSDYTPFLVPSDADSCLALFRMFSRTGSSKRYIDFFHTEFPTLLGEQQTDFNILSFKTTIREFLIEISKHPDADEDVRREIEFLIKKGEWSNKNSRSY